MISWNKGTLYVDFNSYFTLNVYDIIRNKFTENEYRKDVPFAHMDSI